MRVPLLTSLALAGIVPAQLQFTSPPGVGPDGDSVVSSLQPFNMSVAGRRFQYVVDDVREVPGTAGEAIATVALRPDPSSVQSVGRSATVTLVLDHATFASLSATFAANYSGRQTTYALGSVSLPATVGSSGFAIPFALPAPFVYFGGGNRSDPVHTALLVEFQTTGVVGGTSYSLDCADGTTGAVVGRSEYLGLQPCVVPPNQGGFDIIRHGPTTAGSLTTIGQNALRGPTASFGILALGVSDPNTNYGGLLCAPSRASLDTQLNVSSDAQGAIASFSNPLQLTFPNLVVGQSLRAYTQFVMFDPARQSPQLPVSLSDAIQFDVTPPITVDRRTIYATGGATAVTGTVTTQFVPVMRFN